MPALVDLITKCQIERRAKCFPVLQALFQFHLSLACIVRNNISKSVLRDFSTTVGEILQQWHFPGATDVYFDETTKDVVIGGWPRGSRGAGLCAITYSAFTLALFAYCRSRNMPH